MSGPLWAVRERGKTLQSRSTCDLDMLPYWCFEETTRAMAHQLSLQDGPEPRTTFGTPEYHEQRVRTWTRASPRNRPSCCIDSNTSGSSGGDAMSWSDCALRPFVVSPSLT